MTSSEENQASRKRPRKSVNTVESSTGGQKARGRPRVDTQDATATEVRIPDPSTAANSCTRLVLLQDCTCLVTRT